MKKILFITNHSYMFWQFRRELVESFLDSGWEVLIATPFAGHEKDLEDLGARVIETKLERRSVNPLGELKLISFYRNLIRNEKPSLVITYSIKPNIYAGLAAAGEKIPYAANVQGMGTAFEKRGLKEVAAFLYRKALKKAGIVFFENSHDARFFVRNRIVDKDKVCVLPGAGVNTDFYGYQPPHAGLAGQKAGRLPDQAARHADKKTSGIADQEASVFTNQETGQKVHFLYLGRIMKEKGIDELFEAVEEICSRSDAPIMVLDLVGFCEEAEKAVYEPKIRKLEEKGVLVFHGFQEDPRPWYGLADCVVLPSYHEGMSNVLLEAASSGRMLITSDISGCREAVEDGKTGLLVKAKDAGSLAQAMEKVLLLSDEERIQAGLAGRERMVKKFSRRKVVDRVWQTCRTGGLL